MASVVARLIAVMFVMVPASAFAQYYGYEHPYQFNQPQLSAVSGSVQGSVRSIDFVNGRIWVDTGSGTIALNGTPEQVAALNPGEVVSLPYQSFLGRLWIQRGSIEGGGFAPGAYASEGVYTGPVTGVDRVNGYVRVRGVPFRAHPSDLRGLQPGQFVSLSFARIGGVNWTKGLGSPGDTGYGVTNRPMQPQMAPQPKAEEEPAAKEEKREAQESEPKTGDSE